MSIGRISAGNGYEYLTRSVRNDAHDYYVGAGEAPGRWTGGGASRLDLQGEVGESEMALLFGAAAHPHSGEILSTPYRHYRTIEERIESKLVELGDAATPEDRLRIRAEQYRIGDRAPVAGYDCTFSPAKSVSALWALAPADQRAVIEMSHDRAVDAAFGWLEDRALHTRAGRDGVRHLDAEGFVVARFRHRTNRNGDPQLHTHCAVANRVWSTTEGRWRALDGQGLYRERAGADAVYMAAVEHELTDRLGVTFERRGDVREIASVPAPLVERWSSRRAEVLAGYNERSAELGRAATPKERSDVLRSVTLQTRAPKVKDGHVGLHARWADEAAMLGVDWSMVSTPAAMSMAGEIDRCVVVAAALDELQAGRAQWSYSHLTKTIALNSDRALTSDELRDLAGEALRSQRVVDLQIADVGDMAPMCRCDGESVYRDPQRERYSTVAVTGAETFLLETADMADAPTCSRASVKAELARMELGVDQAAAVEQILCGSERITVLIGPAGTGKTYTQRAVVELAQRHGRGVFGLATSQNAADVLAEQAGCRVENIARTRANGWDAQFPHGGIVVVDEAAMAGTLDLAWVAERAHDANCKVVFVGDDRQLQSPAAGGIVRRMSNSHHTVWLTDVRRFSAEWEGAASVALRVGDAGITAVYEDHGRIRGGSRDDMLAEIVSDWWEDQLARRNTALIARDNDTVAHLSAAARALRVAAGDVEPDGVRLHDGTRAGVGDRIVTRDNNRQLRTETDRDVVNRAVWRVTERHRNGSLTVVNERWGDRVFLPPTYVAEHVELAYAATIAGVQGRTLDGARALFDERTARDQLYVAMTRGRHFNIGYGVLDAVSDTDDRPVAESAAGLFARVIGNDSREASAMDFFADELALSDSTVRLDAIRDDWRHVLLDHLRAGQRVVAGDLVCAGDPASIGTVQLVDHDHAVVHFSGRRGTEADVDLPLDELTVVMRHDEHLGYDADLVGIDDPWAAKLLEYLHTVEAARAERAGELAAAAAGQGWTLLVPADLLADVAYFRDRWNIDEPMTTIGSEPGDLRSTQHTQWAFLRDRLGPTGTLAELAEGRAAGVDPTTDAALVAAMTRRRDAIVADVNGAQRPPAWAHPMLRRATWATSTAAAGRERDVVGKAAVYRERFAITGDGVGPEPSDTVQRRIWMSLRDALRAPRSYEDQHQDRHRDAEVNQDRSLER